MVRLSTPSIGTKDWYEDKIAQSKSTKPEVDPGRPHKPALVKDVAKRQGVLKFDSSWNNEMPTPLRFAFKASLVLWASPYSLLGITIGCIGCCLGGKIRLREGALEFFDGFTASCVRRLPTGPTTLGITLGHVILGQTDEGLRIAGDHERVHVRQYERWGPMMGIAYLLCSAWLWLMGKDAYLDNPFEVEAYAIDSESEVT